MPLTTLGVPEPNMPLPLLQPGDLSVLADMPALRLLCVPLSDDLLLSEGNAATLQSASVQQWLLCKAFCALLPRLVTLSYSAAQVLWLFQGATIQGGLDPAKHAELQACLHEYWEAQDPEVRQGALDLVRRAAQCGQLSPQAQALLEAVTTAPTAGEPAAAPEPS